MCSTTDIVEGATNQAKPAKTGQRGAWSSEQSKAQAPIWLLNLEPTRQRRETIISWEAIGAIAEMLAAIGVLATLVYLSFQIRHNSASVDTATEDGIASGFGSLNAQVANNPSLARIITVGLEEPDVLTDEETIQFSFIWRAYLNQYHRLFRLFQKGVIPASRWEEYARELAEMSALPGGKAWRAANPAFPDIWEEIDRIEVRPSASFRLDEGNAWKRIMSSEQ